jgi:hypothetical protein
MRLFTKCFASILAVAIAGSLSLGGAQAVAKLERPSVTSTVEKVAAKKATKKKAAKKAKKSGWKSCGVGKYHDKKTGKCAAASAKK